MHDAYTIHTYTCETVWANSYIAYVSSAMHFSELIHGSCLWTEKTTFLVANLIKKGDLYVQNELITKSHFHTYILFQFKRP